MLVQKAHGALTELRRITRCLLLLYHRAHPPRVLLSGKHGAIQDVPDIHPNVAAIFKQKVERLTETLNHPEDRQEASEAIRALIEKIVVTPGKVRGEIHATLHGELGTLLDFAASRSNGKPGQKKNTPEAGASGVSSWDIAGAGLVLNLRQPQIKNQSSLGDCFSALFSACF